MSKTLWLFNLLLVSVVLALAASLMDTVTAWRSPGTEPLPSVSQQRSAALASGTELAPPVVRPALPPLSEFEAIVQKEVFKTPVVDAPAPPPPPRRPPPPAPLPTLVGTVFVGEERKAILIQDKKADIYSIGQTVGGGTLVRVERDRVVIQRGDTPAEVLLKASIQPVPSSTTGGATRPGAARPSAAPTSAPDDAPDTPTVAEPTEAGSQATVQTTPSIPAPGTPATRPETSPALPTKSERDERTAPRQHGVMPDEQSQRVRDSMLNPRYRTQRQLPVVKEDQK
jgi:hypothetical protein